MAARSIHLILLSLLYLRRSEGSDYIRSEDLRPFDFVFGWSTGHVGTTTLSKGSSYGDPSSVTFVFEELPSPFGRLGRGRVRKMSVDYLASLEEEERFVSDRYIPHLLAFRGNASTLVDLGHHNLYFAQGLLDYLHRHRQEFRVLFIRVRRERYLTVYPYSLCVLIHDRG